MPYPITGCPACNRPFARLIFGVSFFHAVVQERKQFGPLGWNIPYGFNDTDFQISVQQMQLYLNQYDKIPFNAINYLTGECNYGGRVTDVWDRRALITILNDYINEESVEASYHFGGLKSFALPPLTDYQQIVKYIQEIIPNDPSPEVYGLHPNAGITRDTENSEQLCKSTLAVFGFGSGTSANSSLDDDFSQSIRDILDRLPLNYDIEACLLKYPIDYHESMNTVLIQEMQRYNNLLDEIQYSFKEVLKAVEGTMIIIVNI